MAVCLADLPDGAMLTVIASSSKGPRRSSLVFSSGYVNAFDRLDRLAIYTDNVVLPAQLPRDCHVAHGRRESMGC